MSDDWISAAEAFKIVSDAIGQSVVTFAICSRAHVGLIEARAARLIIDKQQTDDVSVPKELWHAEGGSALDQNWATGDFATWVKHKRFQAYGVSFLRKGIEDLVAPALLHRLVAVPESNLGGRPSAAWWDDLWVHICLELWTGDLNPKKQADIEAAMMDWAATQGQSPAESTIRGRARKLWAALNTEGKN